MSHKNLSILTLAILLLVYFSTSFKSKAYVEKKKIKIGLSISYFNDTYLDFFRKESLNILRTSLMLK